MKRALSIVLPICVLVVLANPARAEGGAAGAGPVAGTWRGWLASPGGDLPFGLEIHRGPEGHRAFVRNDPERIEIPERRVEGRRVVLAFPHYDSRIEAELVEGSLTGTWTKRRGADRYSKMAFFAERGAQDRFDDLGPGAPAAERFAGRYRVRFESSEDPAVAIFRAPDEEHVRGTFLTTVGDYRYLAGAARGHTLHLSCFDGAHAFLFHARRAPDGSLRGDFWSSESWHETWSAVRDDDAELPDAFEQTTWTGAIPLDRVVFPDLEGKPRSLDDPAFRGKARILQVFGSWCPNCHDASAYLSELDRRYGPLGLSIVGLAFEHTGDFERDARQVRRCAERHAITYPILVAGLSDKVKATETLRVLDRVRSYPTTIFLRRDGTVRAIHTGFSGPATGKAHRELRREFESILAELLREAGVPEAKIAEERAANTPGGR